MPVAWEQIEPSEGSFDFRLLDHWIDVARSHKQHLVLLWFGTWKNGFSEYAPGWVKADAARFPRARAVDGTPLEILSTFGEETLRLDSRAFAALMEHLKQKDAQQTVLMVQVENEVGLVGDRRDRSEAAERAFRADVPPSLTAALQAQHAQLTPELSAHFDPKGRSWSEVFGDAADEVFMAWRYATYIDSVARAGKEKYALPMYLNVQLPAFLERAGDYPSGGPHPYFQQVYRAVATRLFDKVVRSNVTTEEAELFRGQVLTEMAAMSLDDGLVMQLHPGCFRNHNRALFKRFGRDKGADMPLRTEYVHALKPLLDRFGNEPGFQLLLFTLDESTYSRELAPLAGHYPALFLGPAWWFHDAPEGMWRFREQTLSSGGFYNTVGFNDDTRAFLSIPARHDVARRVDCAFLAKLVAEHRMEEDEAVEVAVDLAYRLPKRAYRL